MRVICHPDHKDEIEKIIELEHPESGIEVLVSKFLDKDQVLVYTGDYRTAVEVLLDNADRDGAPIHLGLPIAAMRLAFEGPPELDGE